MVRDGYRVTVKNKFHPMVIVTAAACVICLLLAACGMSTEEQWQEQYDLGQQYLLEGDYEQAIVAFTAAIEIDANPADAYLGRAGAYAAAGMEESSEEYLTLAAADYTSVLSLYEDEEAAGEIYASRGDVYYALAALAESSDEAAAGEYRSSAVSDYMSAIDFGGAAEEVYVRAAEIYILQEEYSRASEVVTEGLDVYPESGELLGLYNETETLIEEAEEAARLAAEQAELEAEQAALDALAEEYLETARAYEEAGELNAAIHTLYEAYSDSLWDYYEEFYEEWKRIFVPITAIYLYDSEGALMCVSTFEYDDQNRLVSIIDSEMSTAKGIVTPENQTYYEYDDDGWEVYGGFFVIPSAGRGLSGGYSRTASFEVDADPYRRILNESSVYASDYFYEYEADLEYWDYMEITYNDYGLVTRMDCYLEGASSGYALIEYGES